MGLKRRNPGLTRLLTAPEMKTAMPSTKAPAANTEVKPAKPVSAAPLAAPAAIRAISGEERHQMIAKAAYRHAERTGFAADPIQSWLTAEREVDAELARLAS